MTPPATPQRYKHHRFPTEIISHGVWLYYYFCLRSICKTRNQLHKLSAHRYHYHPI
jgi:hypothetical protein